MFHKYNYILRIQVILNQIYGNKCRYTLFLHRDPVQPVSCRHRASSVGNDDKLCILRQFVKIPCITVDIALIKCRLDLIDQTERIWFQVLDGKEKRDRCQGFFPS